MIAFLESTPTEVRKLTRPSLKPRDLRNPDGLCPRNVPRRLKASERSSWDELVRQYSSRMLIVARRMLRTEEDAADAVQDAFLAAFEAFDRFTGSSQLYTWLHRIVVNICLMKLRSRKRRNMVSLDALHSGLTAESREPRTVFSWNYVTTDALESVETRSAVREAIRRLPRSHRTILMLRDVEGLDTVETATLLGVSRSAVKTRLHRARNALRTELGWFLTQDKQREHFHRPRNLKATLSSNPVADFSATA